MKSKHLFLLSFLLSHSAPVWGMDPGDPIKELDTSIKQSKKRIRDNPHYSKDATKIIFIGDTGRGKTSLIHYLAEKKLISILDFGNSYYLNVKSEELLPGFEPIGTTVNAGTSIPSSWYDSRTNTVYWDCPGFSDPRGPVQEIANAFAIHQLFKSGSPFKVVLVASESDATIRGGRAKNFLELLKRVSEVLPDSTSYSGISCVLSQQKDFDPQNLLQTIFNDVSTSPTHAFRTGTVNDLLRSLTAQGRSVAFPEPTQVGGYPNDHRAAILDCINLAQSLVNSRVNLAISADAKLLVTNYAQKLNEKITHLISGKGLRKTIELCNFHIDTNVNNIRGLRTNLKHVETYLSGLKNGLLSLSAVSEDQITGYLDILFAPNEMTFFPTKKLRGMIETVSFLKSIDPNITCLTNVWGHTFNTILAQIQELTKVPEVEVNQNTLTLKGFILGTSDVEEALQYHQQTPINTINVFSLNTLFIDQNLTCPSASLNLFSSTWKVLGNKVISLCGLAGAPGVHGINPGEDGQPGGPGGNAGSIYGKGERFSNLNQLILHLAGGPGGVGGNGMSGRDGVSGRDGDLSVRTFKEKFTYYQAQGTDGQPGQNGGRGGSGGLGGHKGWVVIEGLNAWNLIAADGVMGGHGNAAQGGIGGIHGRHCQGIYETGRTHYVTYTEWVPQNRGEPYTAYRRVAQPDLTVNPWWAFSFNSPLYNAPLMNQMNEHDEEYVAYRTVTRDVPETRSRVEPLPDIWHVPLGFQPSRGSASNGNLGCGLNMSGLQYPIPPVALNKVQTNRDDYPQQAIHSDIPPFMVIFPQTPSEGGSGGSGFSLNSINPGSNPPEGGGGGSGFSLNSINPGSNSSEGGGGGSGFSK